MDRRSVIARPASLGQVCWRALWAVAILAHLRISATLFLSLWHDGINDAHWGRLFLLSASNLFFVIEVLFAPMFRSVRDRRALVAFLLVIAMLHAGPISQSVPQVLYVRDAPVWLGLTAVCVIPWRRVRRIVLTWLRARPAAQCRSAPAPRRRFSSPRRAGPPRGISARFLCAPLRAPPLVSCAS